MKRMVTLASALKVTSWGAAAALIASPDPERLAIWAVFATSAAGVLTNWINRRSDRIQREQQHQWDKEDRESKASEAKADLARSQAAVSAEIEKVGQRADRAYDAGNHVSEKIAALASRPVVVTLTAPAGTDQPGTPA